MKQKFEVMQTEMANIQKDFDTHTSQGSLSRIGEYGGYELYVVKS